MPLMIAAWRPLACRRRLASAKLLKSRYTASGRPASSNKTSNTKAKLIQELFTFFIVQPVHDSSQSSAPDGPSATDCRWRNAKASWLACAADYLFSHRGADFRGRAVPTTGNTWRKQSWQSVGGTWPHFGGNIATASTSNNAPGRASSGTPIVVLAGGAAVLTYLSRTSRNSAIFLPISTM